MLSILFLISGLYAQYNLFTKFSSFISNQKDTCLSSGGIIAGFAIIGSDNGQVSNMNINMDGNTNLPSNNKINCDYPTISFTEIIFTFLTSLSTLILNIVLIITATKTRPPSS